MYFKYITGGGTGSKDYRGSWKEIQGDGECAGAGVKILFTKGYVCSIQMAMLVQTSLYQHLGKSIRQTVKVHTSNWANNK